MRLIYLANARIPTEKAHGVQIMEMCQAFAALGHSVLLVAPRRLNKIKEDAFKYYGVKNNFKIKKISCLDLLSLGFGAFGFWAQTISFLFLAKIYLFFKKYDIIYTREQLAGLFFKNFILEIHTWPAKVENKNIKIWKKAKELIVVTNFIKKRLQEVGINEDKILVAPDAVNVKKFDIDILKNQAREKVGLPPDKYLIGYVGMLKTMEMEKGVNEAIESLKYMNDRIFLVFVGGSEKDIDFYQKKAHELNLQKRIIFVGQVKHELIPFYLKAFDVLIAPYPENEHYRFFMSPLKLFEYMAVNRPIIASDLPSVREVLNEQNSVLVAPGKPGILAEGIKKILGDPELASRLALQAHLDSKKYSWLQRAKSIIEFIFAL